MYRPFSIEAWHDTRPTKICKKSERVCLFLFRISPYAIHSMRIHFATSSSSQALYYTHHFENSWMAYAPLSLCFTGVLGKRLPNSSYICCTAASFTCSNLPSVWLQKGKSWQRNSSPGEWEECDRRTSERIVVPHNTASNKISTRIALNWIGQWQYRIYFWKSESSTTFIDASIVVGIRQQCTHYSCVGTEHTQDAYHE